jgi:hypothetical protein
MKGNWTLPCRFSENGDVTWKIADLEYYMRKAIKKHEEEK